MGQMDEWPCAICLFKLHKQIWCECSPKTPCFSTFTHLKILFVFTGRWLGPFVAGWLLIGIRTTLWEFPGYEVKTERWSLYPFLLWRNCHLKCQNRSCHELRTILTFLQRFHYIFISWLSCREVKLQAKNWTSLWEVRTSLAMFVATKPDIFDRHFQPCLWYIMF